MYSEALEELIELILADDVITDKERAVIHKRAMAEGIDPDEIDIVIEGRLAKKKAASAPQPPVPPPTAASFATAQPAQSKSNKYGEIRKCPNCGALIGAATVKCEECGYEFVGVGVVNSREKLNDIINEIKRRHSGKSTNIFSKVFTDKKDVNEEIAEAIIHFPVPTAKEDLLEFILFLEPLSKAKIFSNSYDEHLTPAYKAKYKECRNKAEVFFSDDPLFAKLFNKKGFFGKK